MRNSHESQVMRGSAGGGAARLFFPLMVMVALAAMLAAYPATSNAAEAPQFVALDAADACANSVVVSRAGYAPGVAGVVVANGDDYKCVTASAVLAAAYGGPVLVTPDGRLDQRVREELWRLGAERVFAVGVGTDVAVSMVAAFPELGESGRLVMLNGSDSVETAILVGEQVRARAGDTGGVVMVSEGPGGAAVAYAVAASGLAAAKSWPLLFVPSEGVLPESLAELMGEWGPSVRVVVQSSVEMTAASETLRIAGSDRYDTSARVAAYGLSVGLDESHIAVVVGSDESVQKALSIGAYMAKTRGLTVMCAEDDVPHSLVTPLTGAAGEVERVDSLGLSERAQERMKLLVTSVGLPDGFGARSLRQRSKGDDVAWLQQRLTDLSYRPGPVDGVFDRRTRQALIAFEKWEGLKRDGIVKGDQWWALLSASRPRPTRSEEGQWIEVDKQKQVLLYCVDGVVERTLAVSSGSSAVGMVTPSGTYRVTRENTWERLRYKPLYLRPYGVLAIHGYPSVPTYPASHGCVRMTWADMDEFHRLIPVGTTVHIY